MKTHLSHRIDKVQAALGQRAQQRGCRAAVFSGGYARFRRGDRQPLADKRAFADAAAQIAFGHQLRIRIQYGLARDAEHAAKIAGRRQLHAGLGRTAQDRVLDRRIQLAKQRCRTGTVQRQRSQQLGQVHEIFRKLVFNR